MLRLMIQNTADTQQRLMHHDIRNASMNLNKLETHD